jgi:hypothetical protein
MRHRRFAWRDGRVAGYRIAWRCGLLARLLALEDGTISA